MSMRLFVAVVLLACCGIVAAGGNTRAVRQQVEVSMMLTGTIEVDPAGQVAGHALDHADALPPGVVRLVAQSLPAWRFAPVIVDGQPRATRAPMRLRVVARHVEGDADRYEISIRSAWFGSDAEPDPATQVTKLDMTPPYYPDGARKAGVAGTVYVLLKVGADGKVEEAAAEQTNLTVVGPENVMRHARRDLERSALAAARGWTFLPPADAAEAAKGEWIVRVPVTFKHVHDGEDRLPPAPGQWESYVPGPRHRPSWLPADRLASGGVDAGPPEGVEQLDKGLRLLAGLEQG